MLHAEQMLPMHEHAPQTPNEPYTTNSLRSGGGTGGMGETRGDRGGETMGTAPGEGEVKVMVKVNVT